MVNYLSELLEPSISKVESWIKMIAANVPIETDWAQSSYGSWYNHPRQHALELMFLASIYIFATFILFRRLLRPGTENYKLLTQFRPPFRASLSERGMTLALICSLLLTLTHKILRNRVWFMLQPCHMSGTLLLFTLVYPDKTSPIPHVFFNMYLHIQWGALAALAFPDLREHSMIGETFNFFAEHILLLVVPIYMIYSRRYVVLPKSKEVLLLSFFSYGFFHTPLLHLISLISGFNLNYMWAPPPIKILLKLGRFYRVVMYGVAFVFKFVTRFICVEAILAFMPLKKIPAAVVVDNRKKSKKI
ncbi:TMEM164 family-domain-containing protein [Cokeromyces recurvatus]|uniref:TMEM164 family-domain-containing protein n=1 Tax=Cokeromyces recurvatus TaxID=90255 RepID=UPI00221F0777|nr:TMEM164 family-domain-containing protein [Cokeromyces recurvatus]KAI7907506.1 TMEM164 family-domain-containing protein [Cokeromyces recurvatus]